MCRRVRLSVRSGDGLVAYGLDVVSVGANDEGRVVVGVVVRSQPWRAIVLGAGSDRTAIELIDLRMIVRNEGEMKLRGLTVDRAKPKGGFAGRSEANGVGELHDHADAERGECLEKKHLARFKIRNADSDVIEHSLLPMDDSAVRSLTLKCPARRAGACRRSRHVPARRVDRMVRRQEPSFRLERHDVSRARLADHRRFGPTQELW